MQVLTLDNINVRTDNKQLLYDISFELEKGTITALVGHNGAGKSTLMKTILGLFEKGSGKILVNGNIDFDEQFLQVKEAISYLPEEPQLLTELTVMQHFQLYGMSYQLNREKLMERVDYYVQAFDLTGKLHEYPESLSKGMRQKVQTICALLPNTPLLLIDEPYMGLDIYAVDYFEQVIQQKREQGTTILLTTHQLERPKYFADHYIMLKHGKIYEKGVMADFETIERRSVE